MADRCDPRGGGDGRGDYRHSLGRCERFDADEERRLFERMRAGDTQARELLIRSQLAFIVSIARRSRGHAERHGVPLDDLIQIGNLAFLRKLPDCDPDRGRLTTWVASQVGYAMMNECRKFGRDAVAKAAAIRSAGGDESGGLAPNEPAAPAEPDFDRLERLEERRKLRAGIGRLEAQTRRVMDGFADGRVATAIAGELDVTRSRVGQIRQRGIDKLREHFASPDRGRGTDAGRIAAVPR